MFNSGKYFWLAPIVVLLMIVTIFGCGDDEPTEILTVDFSYTFVDDNHVLFSNESSGDYLSLSWDFGNGQTESTTSKNATFEVYYPIAGNYEVTLKLTGQNGDTKSISKDLSISSADFSFSVTVDEEDPNSVLLKNTSTGDPDSYSWSFRNKVVENESETVAYFPYAGTYNVIFQVEKDGETYSLIQAVEIAQDDRDYFSKVELVWADEFDGSEVNGDNWTFETGAGGWGNNELQNYTDGDNATVADGILTINAEKVDEYKNAGSYTSTRIITSGKKEFTYGRMEIRAKLPSGTGIWPAIWMLGSSIGSVGWPACGEIDIMEYVGYQPNTVHATVHTSAAYGANGSGSSKTLTTAEEEFHIYGLFWTEKEMIFYIDSINNVTYRYRPTYYTEDNWPFNKPHFFILNVAVGGNWGGAQGIDNTIFPQTMEVDFVHVYQEK